MEKFKILVVLFISTAFSIHAVMTNLNDVVLSGAIQPQTVQFTISNKGTATISLKFIVIQDHVLPLTQGDTTLKPGEVKTVQVPKATSGVKEYKLQVTEAVTSKKPATKEYIIKG